MTAWAALFERAAAYDVDVDDVRESLAAHRGGDRGHGERDEHTGLDEGGDA
ncbi:hypothetical protein [Halobacterium yunchengense]|uniref:hypothetical protein n=1 Tax=Halobacterium yunchengense TaxID=3108497 RepID=UPI0030084EA2